MDASGRLFRQAFDLTKQLGILVVDHVCPGHRRRPKSCSAACRREVQCLLDTPIELFVIHPLPGVNRNVSRRQSRRRRHPLSAENIAAAPGNRGTQFDQSFDEHGGFRGHVQATGNPRSS